MSDKSNHIKIRSCEVEQYFEFYDVDKLAVVESRVKQLTNIKEYCMIVHDKDLNDNGELKKPHFHAVLVFSKPTTIGAVAKGLLVEPQYVQKIKSTTTSAKLYLVHRNDQSKYQYNPEEVLANFDYISWSSKYSPKDRKETIATQIANGDIKYYNLYEHITVHEYATNKQYYENCFKYRQAKMKNLSRNISCVFITGPSGSGKTTFAKELATNYGYSCFISSGGKNPLDDYGGQECIILDDLRDYTYDLSDFLKLTDNHTDSLVGCRFYNKSIAECKLLIVTSIKSIEEFYGSLSNSYGEEAIQLYRRFKTKVVMDKNDINLYNFNEDKNDYIFDCCLVNHITVKYKENIENVLLKDIRTKFGYSVVKTDRDIERIKVNFGEEEKQP